MGKGIAKEYDRLIKKGGHVVMIKDSAMTTIQPLTTRGYEAICRILDQQGAPAEVKQMLAKKKHGHYVAALPINNTPVEMARILIHEQGLPKRSVVFGAVDREITPLMVGDEMH